MFDDWITAAKNIFFPPLCLYCEDRIPEGVLCLECEQKIIFLRPPLCRRCSMPVGFNANTCKECLNEPRPYHRAISAAAYKGPMIRLIHLFKYKNYSWLGEFFARLIINQLPKAGFDPRGYNLITAVPSHKYKLKKRGYNQAAILAKLLSNNFKIPFKDDIIKSGNIGPSQTRLSQDGRRKNVEKAFRVKKNLNGKKIILIDDIFTTGSTASACAKELKGNGADTVAVVTVSKTINRVSERNSE